MKPALFLTVAALSVLALTPTFGARGGRGGRIGGGAWGGWGGGIGGGPVKPPTPAETQAATAQRVKDLIAQGYKALHEADAATALDNFSDAIQLRADSGEAYLGAALAFALKGNNAKCQAALDLAIRNKAEVKWTTYNQAALYTRDAKTLDRAATTLHIYLSDHPKPVDDLMAAAETAVIAHLTDAQRKAIPGPVKALEPLQKAWAKEHADSERWCLAWTTPEEAQKFRDAKLPDDYPTQLPFLLPDETVLATKDADAAGNPLANAVALVRAQNLLARHDAGEDLTAIAKNDPKPDPKADPKPDPTGTNKPVVKTPAPARALTTRGAAFAIDKDVLVTSLRIVAGAKEISIMAVDGQGSKATVLLEDAESGLALLKVEGDTFEPLQLAEKAPRGTVNIACFPKAAIFQPGLESLKGDLVGSTPPALKMSVHPRTAGAPLLNDQGRVVGILTASRDDAPEQLPVLLLDTLAAFVKGHTANPVITTKDPHDAVVEIEATRGN